MADSYFSGPKIKWIIDNVDGVKEKIKEGRVLAGTADSWLIWKMTHGKVHITDCSTASRTMMFNIHTGKWDDEILDILGISRSILPEICDSSMVYGYTDPLDFFGAKIPISGSVVDQQAALFGQACFAPGTIKCTYGTGCFMLMNTGEKPIYSSNGLLTTVAWRLNKKMTFGAGWRDLYHGRCYSVADEMVSRSSIPLHRRNRWLTMPSPTEVCTSYRLLQDLLHLTGILTPEELW